MPASQERERPKLRKVDSISVQRESEAIIVLRDPLFLCDPIAIDKEYLPVLRLMDGTRSTAQIRQSVLMRLGLDIDIEDLHQFVHDIGDHGLLEGQTFRDLWEHTHQRFIEAPFRPSMWGNVLYPENSIELRNMLSHCLPETADRFVDIDPVVGLVCPYQAFENCSDIYRSSIRRLPQPKNLDAILILGTDHVSGLTPFSLVNKSFQTPLGIVSTADRILKRLIERLPWITREEIRHRSAVSIEMSVILLQHIYGEQCPPIIPVLCSQNVGNLAANDQSIEIDQFLAEAELILQHHRILTWASAELSHVGPAYGTTDHDVSTLKQIANDDVNCLAAISEGRPQLFMERCMNRSVSLGRPSGTATFATLMQLLPVGYRTSLDVYTAMPHLGPEKGQLGLAAMRFWNR